MSNKKNNFLIIKKSRIKLLCLLMFFMFLFTIKSAFADEVKTDIINDDLITNDNLPATHFLIEQGLIPKLSNPIYQSNVLHHLA